MRTFFYRLYIALMKANLAVRQKAFQIYLGRRKARLEGADLSYLDLSGTDLSGASLFGADLTRSDLTGVKLDGADLREANFYQARVTMAQLATADALQGAILPDGRVVAHQTSSHLL